jgi:hypothetical protein
MPAAKKSSQTNSNEGSDVHIDEKFLQEHLKDVRSEMSWRRELEFRLMQFLLVFYPIIGTAMVALFQSEVSAGAFSVAAIGASLLILTASIFVTDRIFREHDARADMGREVQKIWAYFGLFQPGAYIKNDTVLPPGLYNEKTGFGQGQGHKKTLALIWLITIAMVLVFATLAFLKA